MDEPAREIAVSRDDLIAVLRHLNTIVVSLDRIGSEAATHPGEALSGLLASFHAEWDVFRRLARCRRLLSDCFPSAVGADGMDELERELQGLRVWGDGGPPEPLPGE